jgi:major membrane immunogen (membrane-anchored lipoprotein)
LTFLAVKSDDDAAWSNYLEIALKSGEIVFPGR